MTRQSDNFSKSIMLSLMVHISIVLIYSLKLTFFPEESLIYEQAIRVDLVALPDKIADVQGPPPIEAAKEPVKPVEPAKVDEPPKSKPLDPTVILEKLRKSKKPEVESAIDKMRKDVAIDKVKELFKDEKQKELKSSSVVYKGNILSAGTELTGVNKLDHQDYHAVLDRHVKQFWRLPEWVNKNNLKAQIRIYLNENGLLVDAKIVKSSGQPSYDEDVMDAVNKASPYPAPPAKFRDIVRSDGILLGFPE